MTFRNFMNIAISEAKKQDNEIPIGCVIIYKNDILFKSSNQSKENPLAHAEIIAINQALNILGGKFLQLCDMYVTLEPCPMCAFAISLARIKNLYIGTQNQQYGAITKLNMYHNVCNHKPNIYFGIAEQECKNLLKDFFEKRR
jgi:tRNA(adenine34) deaminase